MNNEIELYPGNWLYNASVIGFLSTIEPSCYTFENGIVKLNKSVFEKLDIENNYFDNNKIVNLKGKNHYYPNYIDAQGKQKRFFENFIKNFINLNNSGNNKYCDICQNPYYIEEEILNKLKIEFGKEANKFLDKISYFNNIFNANLGPSIGEFPNGFWNMNNSLKVCHLCSFIIIHNHLAFKHIFSNGFNSIFINSSSFKLSYELNKFIKETYEISDKEENKLRRTILATSIIEYTNKFKSNLGMWSSMNLEIITKTINGYEFYTLPFDIVRIISDREIASLLSDLAEFKILNFVLNKNYNYLIDFGEKLLRFSLNNDKKNSTSYKNELDKLLYKEYNKQNLTETINKIFKLYTLIEEKNKGN